MNHEVFPKITAQPFPVLYSELGKYFSILFFYIKVLHKCNSKNEVLSEKASSQQTIISALLLQHVVSKKTFKFTRFINGADPVVFDYGVPA